ncbi:hypothetical protein [Natronomonas gomsonensis]|uniref:hypothetical protein n=1 Tax=Natronomonas gomsonensis TaxID=1046043 RepID=UPI0015BE2193|nr:hypothetical protein [Natronomonas gomsonensis]
MSGLLMGDIYRLLWLLCFGKDGRRPLRYKSKINTIENASTKTGGAKSQENGYSTVLWAKTVECISQIKWRDYIKHGGWGGSPKQSEVDTISL